jgi:hypothetical protein
MAAKYFGRSAELLAKSNTRTAMSNAKPSSVPERPSAIPQVLGNRESCSSVDPTVELVTVPKGNFSVLQPKRNQRLRCGLPLGSALICRDVSPEGPK